MTITFPQSIMLSEIRGRTEERQYAITGLSPEFHRVDKAVRSAQSHYRAVTAEALRAYFQKALFLGLAENWKQETMFLSSPSEIAQHASYQSIIRMGAGVVPFILEDLAREPALWFEALSAITGEQPVPQEHAGDIEAMAQDWLSWGRKHDLFR